MNNEQFLQHLRDLNLEDGKMFIQEHAAELEDHAAFGELLADEALRLLYTPFVSLKLAEMLIFFGEHVSHLSAHALGLKAKGDALVQIGHFQAAMECLDAARDEFLSLGEEGNAARSRISWITACMWLDRVEDALQEADRTRKVFSQLGEKYWTYVIDNNIAIIYYYIGRYQESIDLNESILSIYPTLTNQSENYIKRSISIVEVNQALNLAMLGHFERAYKLYEHAYATFIALEESSCITNTEINLADLDYIQGYYGSALRRYYQARDRLMEENLDNPFLLAEVKLRMGDCLVKLNRAHEACQLINEVVEIYKQSDISLSTGIALREYATALIASEQVKEALTILDEAWKLFRRGGFETHASTTKLCQAELLLATGNAVDAYHSANLIKKYFESQNLVSYSVNAGLVMVRAFLEKTRWMRVDQEEVKATVLLCKQLATQAHEHNLQEAVYRSQYLLGQLSILQENPKRASWYYSAAITQIEHILEDLAYDLSPSFLHTTWAVYEDMIALCLERVQFERAFSYLERARSMALRQYISKPSIVQDIQGEKRKTASQHALQANSATMLRMQQELKDWQERYHNYSTLLWNIDASVSPSVDQEVIKTELKHCETKLSELFERLSFYQSEIPLNSRINKQAKRNAKQIDIAQLRQQLAPNQLLLAYFLYKGRLVIFAATSESLVTYENPEGERQLEVLFALLHDAHLRPGGWPNTKQPPQQAIRRLLNKLYKLLIAPAAEMLPSPGGSLTIVPYGPLHKLPFHALHDGSQFLIENFQINYLPASNMLMHFSHQKSKQAEQYPDVPPSIKRPLVLGYSGNGSLQRTVDEVKVLAEMLDGQYYLEGDATIAKLIEQAPGSPMIHIATHGQSRLDAPNFSHVLLADGQLNAIDVFNLDLEGCELVTLSGCETGLALSGGGDEQLGLGRAFLAAGAKSLVMSLWAVEDNATNELMQHFYRHLLNGESKVQALQSAQCHLLHSTSANYSHPYFWAAFRLVGDVSPLRSRVPGVVLAESLLNY